MRISEYNLKHHLRRDEQVEPWAGVHFIYGGPAGTGPHRTSEGQLPVTRPANTVSPAIGGSPEVGAELTCAAGTWTGTAPITYSYVWLRDSVAILGATRASYTIRPEDGGYTLSCEVTASNAAGVASALSEPVETLGPPVNLSRPTLSAPPAVEQTVTCEIGSWAGPKPQKYSYAWFSGGELQPGAVEPTYYPIQEEEGRTLSCEVKARNKYGTRSATSEPALIP
jgi:hypothetical protein